MAETVVLDPAAVAVSRTAFDITPFISVEGVDWGDAQITAQIADGMYGGDPVDFRVPNRQVTMPLKLMARGTATFEQSRRWFQAKTALIQREGGWLSRVTSAGTLYADVVNASLKLGGGWLQANKSADVDAELSLELKPDWYGAEITLDDKTETTLPVLTTVLKQSAADAVIAGDYPARVRVVVDEDDGDTQLGLIWGFRSRYYDSATTAALTYEAEALTPLDVAATFALAGASGGTVIRHNNLLANDWTPVLSTQMLSGTAHLTHRGTYRVWARVHSTATTPPRVRFVWDVGDLALPVDNTAKTIPAASAFYQLDLGEIRLDAAPVGTHRWMGHVQAYASANGDNVSVDAISFQPVDDGCGRLTASLIPSVAFTSYAARDPFTGTSSGGTLNGRVAPLGGTWVTSGAATDFTFVDDAVSTSTPTEHITRSAAGVRYAILGSTNYTNVTVSARVGLGGACGVIARWTDANNYVTGRLTGVLLQIAQVVAGVETVLTSVPLTVDVINVRTLTLTVFASGLTIVVAYNDTGAAILRTSATSTTLATGGTLATGKPGLFDNAASAGSGVGRYDDFVVSIPTQDAVLFPNQSAQLTTDGMFREDTGGTAYGPVSAVGNLPRLPPSGLESRKVELFVKGSRGDFDQLPDNGIDDISAQAFYRPGWLIAPGS